VVQNDIESFGKHRYFEHSSQLLGLKMIIRAPAPDHISKMHVENLNFEYSDKIKLLKAKNIQIIPEILCIISGGHQYFLWTWKQSSNFSDTT
jgi:hypothetical protein